MTAPTPKEGEFVEKAMSRDAFEVVYAADATASGWACTPEEVKELREGAHYGGHRTALNFKWEGWQLASAHLEASERVTAAQHDAIKSALDDLWVLHGNGFATQYERPIATLQAALAGTTGGEG